jgi:2-polyprenyl-3-methyl-5-hydroxy-6-metoxy-1,4-benzoquinol methylase
MQINDIRPRLLMKKQKAAYNKDLDFYRNLLDQFCPRNCPGCNKHVSPINLELKRYFEKDGFNYSKCESCWTIYMNPGPTKDLIKKFYEISENYKFFANYIYPETAENRSLSIHKARVSLILESLEKFRPWDETDELKILEVGAGNGAVLSMLKKLMPRWNMISVEPNSDSIKSGLGLNTDFRVVNSNFEDSRLQIDKQDVICAFEVLEHILNPIELFDFAKEHLKENGLLIFTTPNAHSIEVNYLKKHSTTIDIEHISVLTPSAIFNLASKTNFVVEGLSSNGYLDVDLIITSFRLQKFVSLIFYKLMNLFSIQNKIREFNLSSNMKIVLRKVNF